MIIYQPSIFSIFEPDEEIDENVLIIGNPETQRGSEEEVQAFLQDLKKCSIFALDTETFPSLQDNPSGALYFKYNKIRLLQTGLEDGRVLIIDFGGWPEQDKWEEIRNLPEVIEVLEILAERSFNNSVAILGVNLSFDFNNLREHFGIICRQARDLMILSQIIWSGVGAYKHGMTALCAISHGLKGIAGRLGYEVDKSQQVSAWGWTLTGKQVNYAAKDVRILFPMFADMRRLINQEGLQYTARAESRAVAVFANMQYLGTPVRLEEAQRLLGEQKEIVANELVKFNEVYPDVQYTSQPQVLEALRAKFPDLNIENTAKETLITIDCPGVKALLKAKKAEAQVKSCQTILDYAFSGSIHALYNQISPSATGRSTSRADVSSRMNGKRSKITIGLQAQNINKKIKDIFGFEEDGEMILGVYDGSAMHQRIATQFSADPQLIAGYLEDKDLHSLLASQIAVILGENAKTWTYDYLKTAIGEVDEFDKPTALALKAKGYRNVAKTAFYGALNGSGAGKILMALHAAGYGDAEFDHANQIYKAFYTLYAKLVAFIKSNHKAACETKYYFDFPDDRFRSMKMHERAYGKIRSLTGRIQYLEFEKGKHGEQVSYTKATGNLWQLAEGDMLKMWMSEVQDKFWETPEWHGNILNMIHDELLLSCKKEYKDEVAKFVVDTMVQVWSKWVNIIPVVPNDVLENPSSGMVYLWSQGK